MRHTPLPLGNPAPWFICRSTTNPKYNFNSVAGRHIVLCFFGSAGDPDAARVLADVAANRRLFDDENAAFFGVTTDPQDEQQQRIREHIPGIRFFLDFDLEISKLYGLVSRTGEYKKLTYILDCALRVIAVLPFADQADEHFALVLKVLRASVKTAPSTIVSEVAPVLTVPYVFEEKFCRELIEYYEKSGGGDSGYMQERDGKTVGIIDYGTKRRRDVMITDERLRKACASRLDARLRPAIERAYQFNATRLERHLVSCYDASEGGYFRPHRDNTTSATAYRRFAVSLFLNTGEYEGGFLRFPEFGKQLYTAPAGGAVVFSCSLLHEATPVTRGKRYMYLPFLFDEAAEIVRQQCLQFLE